MITKYIEATVRIRLTETEESNESIDWMKEEVHDYLSRADEIDEDNMLVTSVNIIETDL